MKVSIFFSKNTRDSGCYRAKGSIFNTAHAVEAFNGAGYELAATIDMTDADTAEDAVEYAYVATQNINTSWRNPPCRSTMVGDIFEVDGARFIVASMGFDRLDG